MQSLPGSAYGNLYVQIAYGLRWLAHYSIYRNLIIRISPSHTHKEKQGVQASARTLRCELIL